MSDNNKRCTLISDNDLPKVNINFIDLEIKNIRSRFIKFLIKYNIDKNTFNNFHSNIKWGSLNLQIKDETQLKELFDLRKNITDFLNKLCYSSINSPEFIKSKCYTDTAFDKIISTCKSFGSTNVTSDIDITISGQCIAVNLTKLKLIRKYLKDIFDGSKMYSDNSVSDMSKYYLFNNSDGSFDIKKVHLFFDINYYISNFAIKKNKNEVIDPNQNKTDLLSSFYISNSLKQIDYALLEYKKLKYKMDYSLTECSSELEYDTLALNTDKIISSATVAGSSPDNINNLINNISEISTFEDECYHSQGAFFHVVLIMQRGINFTDSNNNTSAYNFLLVQSFIENLCFSFTHFNRRDKYLKRAIDAKNRLLSDINNNFSQYINLIKQTNIDSLINSENNVNIGSNIDKFVSISIGGKLSKPKRK